ncbi:Crp/Fnr family transcriptional regulator (plasmid) [Flammeovirga sp. MY04]|uniref:Crp/Fnr family transcriptional regulator n=1 Tax=Flammeovirga sp. MY04 TaxID=1191459 RepID=UPI0008062DF4|nr:Crp/Fnr family transcriptional regulator [Flammeovirga sp. MY04]ANQ52889.1 Crp/Fnr family transcriptional regulator [Flammeovirga sp. MY04]
MISPEFLSFWAKSTELSSNEILPVFIPSNKTRVYLVMEGKLIISRIVGNTGEEIVQDILTPGDVFNQRLFIGVDMYNNLTAIAGSKGAKLLYMSTNDVHLLKKNNIVFEEMISDLLKQKLKSLEDRIEVLSFRNPHERIVRFIGHLQNKMKGSSKIYHNYSHDDISKLTRVPRPLVTKILLELREEGKIDYARGVIEILDFDRIFSD